MLWAVGSPSVTISTTGSASECLRRCRPASRSACCRLVPFSWSGSTAASSVWVSGDADRPKPMICRASCGNFVATRCDSASAVCFIGPQQSRSSIENDRSTQQRHGSRRAPLGLHHLEVIDLKPHRRTRTRPQNGARQGAHHVQRLLVAELPRPRRSGHLAGGAGVAQVVLAAPPAVEVGEDRSAARCRRAAAAPSGSA